MTPPTPNRAALRHTAARVLDALEKMLRDESDERRLTVQGIADAANVSKTSAKRSLAALVQFGFIQRRGQTGCGTFISIRR